MVFFADILCDLGVIRTYLNLHRYCQLQLLPCLLGETSFHRNASLQVHQSREMTTNTSLRFCCLAVIIPIRISVNGRLFVWNNMPRSRFKSDILNHLSVKQSCSRSTTNLNMDAYSHSWSTATSDIWSRPLTPSRKQLPGLCSWLQWSQ